VFLYDDLYSGINKQRVPFHSAKLWTVMYDQYLQFEILMTVIMDDAIFWDMLL